MAHHRRTAAGNRRRAALAAVLLAMDLVVTLPVWQRMVGQAAVAAVAVAMPESGLYQLRRRFAPEAELPDQPQPPEPAKPQAPPREEESPQAEPEEETAPPRPDDSGDIPAEYRGRLLRETMTGEEGSGWLALETGWLRNHTALGEEEIEQALKETSLTTIPAGEAQVLILHTHATESYETHRGEFYDIRSSWRTQENDRNMCGIGDIMAEELEAAGITVIHDTTQHDYPSYNGSYDRSRKTAEEILAKYPGVSVILDVHRDAIQRDETTVVAPVTVIEGEDCAQVMLIVGCDDGSLGLPNWRQNLRLAAAYQSRMEADHPTLTRPLFFAHRKYNQDISPGALLLEVGASGNTFEEAALAARLAARSLAGLLQELEEKP